MSVNVVFVNTVWKKSRHHSQKSTGKNMKSLRETIAGIVRIQGNSLTRDNVIRRDVMIDPGRPLDARQVEEATKRLERTRLSSATCA